MQLKPSQLGSHLAHSLLPAYVVHGDEPLLAIEAADQIRAAARKSGFEREMIVAEPGFRWDAFSAALRNLGLFGGRRLVDLRIPSGKPGVEGARVLEDAARHLDRDAMLLVALPRLDRAAQSAAWFAALEQAGASVAVYPLERAELPQWIAGRLSRSGQRVSRETLQFLADRTEGNLLAAQQEVDKLALLLPAGEVATDVVERAVADMARFDVGQLSEAWLAGDARRSCRILAALQAEGEATPLLVWQLGEDLHALAAVLAMSELGTPLAQAVRSARAWGRRQVALELAARRVAAASIPPMLVALARVEALAKGIGEGDPWTELTHVALRLCGVAPPEALHARS